MAIPTHYRGLMGLPAGSDEIDNVPFNACLARRRSPPALSSYDPALGALGFSFKKVFKRATSAVKAAVRAPVAVARVAAPVSQLARKVVQPVVQPVVKSTFQAPLNIARNVAKVGPSVVKNVTQPLVKGAVGVAKNPLTAKSWVGLVTAPVRSQINLATGTTGAATTLAKSAVTPIRALTKATGVDAVATRAAQATRLNKVGDTLATGAAITAVIANELIAKSAGLAPLVPSPLPRTPEAEQLAEDVAYVEQQEQAAEALANAANRAAAAGDVNATAVLAERARRAATNAQGGQRDVVASAQQAIKAGNPEGNVAAAIMLVKTRAADEARRVIDKVITDAKAGTLPPGLTSEVKPGVAGKAMGAGVGALVGTMFLPGVGTVLGAAAGLLFGHKGDVAGAATRPLAGLAEHRRSAPLLRRRGSSTQVRSA